MIAPLIFELLLLAKAENRYALFVSIGAPVTVAPLLPIPLLISYYKVGTFCRAPNTKSSLNEKICPPNIECTLY